MKTKAWKEKFNIPADSEHSLVEILRSGFINEDEYLEWASETYQIPILDAEFFKQAHPPKLLLENPSDFWNETFFPIVEWDSTLFIVCLEPQEIALEKPHCFVLASLFRMETAWVKMEKPAENTITEEFREISSHIQESLTSPDLSFDTLTIGNAEAKATAHTTAPEPLAPSLDLPSFDFAPASSESAEVQPVSPAEPPPAPVAPAVAAPAAAPFNASTPAARSKSASENVYEDSKITSLFTQTETTQISIPDFVIDELMKPEPLKPTPVHDDLGPEDTQVVHLSKTKPEITFTNTKTIMPFPERSTHFSFVRTVFSEQVILEARDKIKENTDPHQALISAFHIMKDYYKKLLWAVRDQKGAVYAIASNSAWDFSEEAWNTPLDFKSPNPFRIAKFTAKPYHGPVYPNPINDQFFKMWNDGKYPPVLSIVPIRLQGKVFAYFVGCEPALHYHPVNSLDILQATCDELVQTFLSIHKELSPIVNKAS